jgi:hypothetical protein
MLRFRFFLAVVLAGMFVTSAYPDSLQDWEFNVNGTTYYPSQPSTFASVPGLNAGGFNSATGLGTFQLTFSPGAAGTYFVGAFFFDPVGVPFYNEYGIVNGSAAAGQSWQIDNPQYDAISLNHGAGTIIDNLAAGTLSNTNYITGTTSNYLHDCGANGGGAANTSCNDLVSMAMGFSFTLAAGQSETITLNLSSTNPGGFSLEDFHPVDGNNKSAAGVFYSGTAVTGGGGPPHVPEPGSGSLAAMAVAVWALVNRKRFLRKQEG